MRKVEILDFPGYFACENGDIIGKRGHALNGKITWDGYREVVLSEGARRRSVRVHRLIMEAFEGVAPKAIQVNHKDGNKLNNCLSNLEYVTVTQNSHHAYQTGLHKTNTLCNLHYMDFHKMLEMYNCGFSYTEICEHFNLGIVRKDYLGDVLSGRKLKSLTGFTKDMRVRGQTASKKFSDSDVARVKDLRGSGKTYSEIQEEIPMSMAQISRILNGKRRMVNDPV